MQLSIVFVILVTCGLSKVFGFHQSANQLSRRQRQISNAYNFLKMTALEDFVAKFNGIFMQKTGAAVQ
jgi:hypothetical protein